MTQNALKLVGAATFYSLSRNPVIYEMFKEEGNNTQHIDIAEWGDVLVIVPATANIIGKIAGGIADDILSTAVMAFLKKIIIAPAMNKDMYANKILQSNIQKLKDYGYFFIEPEKGYLACGYEGKGRLAKIETIIEKICQMI
jgi:phosphopantothenoylcysteine decarboxylase/phosphopantothenate--cysteine ligase